jgi:hypothetical protein
VIRVQDEQEVQGVGHDRVDLDVLTWRPEHHAKEVLGVAEPVVGIEEGLSDRVFI